MDKPKFVYVTYIRATPEKLWQALTEPEFTRRYWCASWQECEWKPGSSWKMMVPDGTVTDSGEVLEVDPSKTLSYTWGTMGMGSVVTFTLTPTEAGTHVRVEQAGFRPDQEQNYRGAMYGWKSFMGKLENVVAGLA